jgi:hypothetical protein
VPPDGFAASATDCPRSMVGDDGLTSPLLRAKLTMIEAPLEPGAFVESPVYAAWTVTPPAAAPFTVTEQAAGDPERLHVAGEKDTRPAPPVEDQAMSSPATGPVTPVTVAVHVVEEPTSMVVEVEHAIDVLVVTALGNSSTLLLPASATQALPEESKTIDDGPFRVVAVSPEPPEVKLV